MRSTGARLVCRSAHAQWGAVLQVLAETAWLLVQGASEQNLSWAREAGSKLKLAAMRRDGLAELQSVPHDSRFAACLGDEQAAALRKQFPELCSGLQALQKLATSG